ncbi:MAG: hypothetical protein JSV65_10205 [Armatimonadota bacterium]|nr:MAG: hypothetical protein JSV65_10205 [Armatimonadota bacterium]
MRITNERLEIKPTFDGKDSAAGWLQISLKGLDLEGVQWLYLDLADVEGLRGKQSQGADLIDRLRRSLENG